MFFYGATSQRQTRNKPSIDPETRTTQRTNANKSRQQWRFLFYNLYMSIFSVILEDILRRRGISMRQAAREIGISHTTLYAAKNGTRELDVSTAVAIAKWAGVPLSTLVEEANPGEQKRDEIYQAITIILTESPELRRIFVQASAELARGALTLDDFRDVADFMAFKIEKRRRNSQQG